MAKSTPRSRCRRVGRGACGGTALVALIGLAACGGGEADEGTRTPLVVMTRNLYLGADLVDVILATSLEALHGRVEAVRASVVASDPPARVALIADEIAAAQPAAVALQEVELFRVQRPSDLDPAAPMVNATEVLYDFLELLQAALAARGQRYRVAVSHTLTDVEAPGRGGDGVLYDLRMTDRDVILVREGTAFARPTMRDFARYVEVRLGGVPSYPVQFRRGWSSVDLTVGGAPVLFVNTHLEVGGPLVAFQRDQGAELIAALRGRREQIVAAGDFNSPAGLAGADTYRDLMRVFRDAWTLLPSPVPVGNTCCRELDGPPIGINGVRIDLVLVKGPVTAIAGTVTGEDPAVRTPSGLAASDHAGVVMTVGIKPAP